MLRLSEAIRLGAMLRPQGFGHLFSHGKSCALGAAKEAIGMKGKRGKSTAWKMGQTFDFPAYWPWLRMAVTHPVKEYQCGPDCRHASDAFWVVMHLNDHLRWSRERIADWVESVEPKEESVACEYEVKEMDEVNA